jgi:LacI family transcriptional regulator
LPSKRIHQLVMSTQAKDAMKSQTGRKPKRPAAPPKKRTIPTIHDVARRGGVSAMTVSRVINGHKYVSEKMREKVYRAIKDLDFSPNAAARNIHGGARIALIYTNPSSSNLANYLMGAFRQGAIGGCQLHVEQAALPDPLEWLRKLLSGGFDAVILPPPLCDSDAVFGFLERKGVQALSFATAELRPDRAAVIINDFEGARMMTEHLLELGHRDIAFVQGDPAHSPAKRREAGFRQSMADAGLQVVPERIVPGYFTYRSGLQAARQLLEPDDRPTAVFAANDDMAAAVAAVAHGVGLSIPGDLSIAGFDDTPVATTIWPELTTIRQPIADMASAAVEIMMDAVRRVRVGEAYEPQHRFMPLSLVKRASTAAPKGR